MPNPAVAGLGKAAQPLGAAGQTAGKLSNVVDKILGATIQVVTKFCGLVGHGSG